MGKEKEMYLVTQGQGEYEEYCEHPFLVTESYDEAIAYMIRRNEDTVINYIDKPMTTEEFEKVCNEGLPDGMTYYDIEKEADLIDYDYEAAYIRNAIDRNGHTKEEFIEMNRIINEIACQDWGLCQLYKFKLGEPESFEYIPINVMKK